jgi:hypothetical protein
MTQGSRTLAVLAAGVVLLMAATLAADVVLSNNAVRVVGPPTAWTGEVLYSEMTGAYPVAAAIHGYAPVTGYAVYGEAVGGYGVLGTSSTDAGVRGNSGSGIGGHFTSSEGYGVYAYTTGTGTWDYGLYASAHQGFGLYVRSTLNQGIRAVAGADGLSGFSQPSGTWGVVGLGRNGGVYGSSKDSYGVYGISSNSMGVRGSSNGSAGDYGGYFTGSSCRGLYAGGASGYYDAYFAGNVGIFVEDDIRTNGDIYAAGSKAGYVVDLARNDGSIPLQLGDVVVITGATDPVLGEIPVPTVRLADEAASTGVMGVVDRMFATPADLKAMPQELREEWLKLLSRPMSTEHPADAIVTAEQKAVSYGPDHGLPGTDVESHGRFLSYAEVEFIAEAMGRDAGIAPGAYLGVVTLGAFKAVQVDASYGSILPGDLLVSAPTPGHAMRAVDPLPGTIIGKALGSLEGGQGTVPVLITLH